MPMRLMNCRAHLLPPLGRISGQLRLIRVHPHICWQLDQQACCRLQELLSSVDIS